LNNDLASTQKIVTKSTLKFCILSFLLFGIVFAGFPDKPIKIVVYTGPGGLIDITARKFSSVAAKYVDATFVVEINPVPVELLH
jgi:tripartite-type tricarboxylate transporter receptor subunit TctC